MITLILLLTIPLFELDAYTDQLSGPEYQATLIQNLYNKSSSYSKAGDFLFKYYDRTDYPIFSAVFWNSSKSIVYYNHSSSMSTNSYRDLEIKSFEGDLYEITVWYRTLEQLDSMLKVFKTTFVIFLLILAGMLISSDADKYVLRPLEILISKVNNVSIDPFRALKLNLMK